MPWIFLTPDHLKSAMTAKEVTDFGKSVTDGTPDDRVIPILADLTQEIRGYIASFSQNKLSADETLIPATFKSKALAVARWNVLTSIPGYTPGEARKISFERADTFFKDVARGTIRPEVPDDAVTPDVPAEKPAGAQWQAAGSRTGRKRMNGL